MCLIIWLDDKHVLLTLPDVKDMLICYKQFDYENGILTAPIKSNYIYKFKRCKSGMQSVVNNSLQDVDLVINTARPHVFSDTDLWDKDKVIYKKFKLGYHMNAYGSTAERYIKLIHYVTKKKPRIKYNYLNLYIPCGVKPQDIQLISHNQICCSKFYLLKPQMIKDLMNNKAYDTYRAVYNKLYESV